MTSQELFDFLVNTLVQFIQNKIINVKTGQPFTITDIKIQAYTDAVNAIINPPTGN